MVVVGYIIAMVAKCCVVGCTSGYKSNTEKVSQFTAPKDHGLQQRWQKAIPRKNFVVNDKTYVGSKHFSVEDIVRYWVSGGIKVSMFSFLIRYYYKNYNFLLFMFL